LCAQLVRELSGGRAGTQRRAKARATARRTRVCIPHRVSTVCLPHRLSTVGLPHRLSTVCLHCVSLTVSPLCVSLTVPHRVSHCVSSTVSRTVCLPQHPPHPTDAGSTRGRWTPHYNPTLAPRALRCTGCTARSTWRGCTCRTQTQRRRWPGCGRACTQATGLRWCCSSTGEFSPRPVFPHRFLIPKQIQRFGV
jgi:hypothetical protein